MTPRFVVMVMVSKPERSSPAGGVPVSGVPSLEVALFGTHRHDPAASVVVDLPSKPPRAQVTPSTIRTSAKPAAIPAWVWRLRRA